MRQTWLRCALALGLVAAIAWAWANRGRFEPATLEQAILAHGLWAPLAYGGLYVLITILFLPGSLLGILGGALFGPLWGAVYTLIAATIGATLAFLIARYLASDWIAAKVGGRLKQLVEGVESEGWRFVAFTRLVPIFPFNLLNFALGLTRIRLTDYVVASFLCMAPGTIAYTYLGYAGREAFNEDAGAVQKGLIALGLLALVAFAPRVVRRFRAAGHSDRDPRGRVPTWIDPNLLHRSLAAKNDRLILDVRAPAEFWGPLGHIQGAANVPLDSLPHHLAEIVAARRPVVVVCLTDKRSAQAAAQLEASGARDVVVLRGGMARWRSEELPIDGAAPPALDTQR